MVERGYGMFIHYGINTFCDQDWTDGTIPVSKYDPSDLDCDQWIRVARDAGFRYVLLTTKHHEGFCLWDSKYTDYDVASTTKKTDVVAAVSKACKKYGIKFGIYYSLWDRHEPSYKDKDPSKYVDYMIAQLTELFTGYGDICELWLDGSWDRPVADWQLDRVYNAVKEIQPHCAIGVNWTIISEPNTRKLVQPSQMNEDNKYYIQYFPSDFRLGDPIIVNKLDKKQYLYENNSYYLPFEHTICLSKAWNWFQKSPLLDVRDLDELQELFYWCTDNGNTLVINVPPDSTGHIREHEANTVIALGQRLGIRRNKPLPKNGEFISLNAPASANTVWEGDEENFGATLAVDGNLQTRWAAEKVPAELILQLDKSKPFNKITIFEYSDPKRGTNAFANYRESRIQSYTIDIWLHETWFPIYVSTQPLGDCKVIHFPKKYQTSKLRLNILESTKAPSIYEINVINLIQ